MKIKQVSLKGNAIKDLSPNSERLERVYMLYWKLAYPIDRVWKSYLLYYRDHIRCKAGCSGCCDSGITFFPVEVYYMAYKISREGRLYEKIIDSLQSARLHDRCIFLKDGRCIVYPFRPILCRTFGLPIIYQENGRYLLDICNKNLKTINFCDIKLECVLKMDILNKKLAEINRLFSEIINIDMGIRYTAEKVINILALNGENKIS